MNCCKSCDCDVEPIDVPVWREFNILGVTWIIGRWTTDYPDYCPECQNDITRAPIDRAIEEAEGEGYRRGYMDAEAGR